MPAMSSSRPVSLVLFLAAVVIASTSCSSSEVIGTNAAPVTFSCTELFLKVAVAGPIYTMARIPLANLGAGIPPD